MAFSINTNVASLQAQNYLRINQTFQNQTINEVTSGLRIVNSGDDAAGLAIANGMRSDEAVLTQGIQNANNGLSQLQIADGGMSNISRLLDRARTLATESASGTFTGDRTVLNNEFQSVVTEIDRQAQSIGLSQGGTFAKALFVFVGGGKGTSGSAIVANGSVSVDLSTSTVDTKSLGLKGVQASGVAGTDIGTGSPTTSVQTVLNNNANASSEAVEGYSVFNFYGPGFSGVTGQPGSNPVKVSVNLAGVTDPSTLANAINQAIQNAGNAGSQQATAFRSANITASIVTDDTGKQQLAFSSSTTAFQVQGADMTATALMGQFSDPATGAGYDPTPAVTTTAAASATGGTYELRLVSSAFANGFQDYSVTVTNTDNAAKIAGDIQTQIAGNAAGITVSNAAGNSLVFKGQAGETFEVLAAGDTSNDMGLGTFQLSGGNFNYNSITGGAISANSTNLQISVGGGPTIDLGNLAEGGSMTTALAALNGAFGGNATLKAIGLTATSANGTNVTISSTTGANFRINSYGAADGFGFGSVGADSTALGDLVSTVAAKTSLNAQGSYASINGGSGSGVKDVYSFADLRVPSDKQTIAITASDPSGTQHTLTVNLTSANASTVDEAVQTLNTQLLQSDDSVLQGIVAVAERNAGNSGTGIRLMSANNSFSVSLGQTANGVGLADANQANRQGEILTSQLAGTGSTVNIASQATAQAAVTALSSAVAQLGNAQAVVGRGENEFNYAINLAQSQLTNTQAAESTIRDADLAAESANLTKAQILIQAGVAALAQANSAPQQVLSLLQK